MSDNSTRLIDELWSVAEFAREIDKSPRTVQRLIQAGFGPPVVYIIDKPYIVKDKGREWLLAQTTPAFRGRGKAPSRANKPCFSDLTRARRAQAVSQ